MHLFQRGLISLITSALLLSGVVQAQQSQRTTIQKPPQGFLYGVGVGINQQIKAAFCCWSR
jgi:hypothetical protein